MRNPNRIKPFLNKFLEMLKKQPIDFYYLITRYLEKIDPFYFEEEEFLINFESFIVYLPIYNNKVSFQIKQQICKELERIWLKFPDWRFGQLLVNIYDKIPLISFISDEEYIEKLKTLFK
ncbi:MAG: hypothetical protein MJ224_01290 [archaeon]|nr:hypothetical protein [archaeon]